MNIKAVIAEVLEDVDAEAMDRLDKAIFKLISDGYVKKELYKEKLSEITSLKDDLETVRESLSTAEAELSQFDAEMKERGLALKKELIAKKLEAEGALPQALGLLVKEFDLESIEVNDGDIVDWESILAPVRDAYAGVFERVYETGASCMNPPRGERVAVNPWNKEKPDLEEQIRLYRENPELARELAASCNVKL